MLEDQLADTSHLKREQARRLKELETKKQRLYDAYLEAAISVAELKKRQEQIEMEIVNAQALLQDAQNTGEDARQRLDTVLDLLDNAVELYQAADETAKRALMQAMFERIDINIHDEDSDDSGPTEAHIADIPAVIGQTIQTCRQTGRTPVAFPGHDAASRAPGRLNGHPRGQSPGNSPTCAHIPGSRKGRHPGGLALNDRTPTKIFSR